jgi:hypothetical protein
LYRGSCLCLGPGWNLPIYTSHVAGTTYPCQHI